MWRASRTQSETIIKPALCRCRRSFMVSEVLVVFPQHESFIDQDIRLLQNHFGVAELEYSRRHDRFTLVRELRRTRVAIAWFVLGYAYALVRLRPLFGVKSLLIPGGWDVEALPELGYGEMLSKKRGRRTTFALSRADRVLAVSLFNEARVRRWAPAARVDVVYHGFDSSFFSPGDCDRVGVMTVARFSPATLRLKGLSTFLEVAKRLPEVPFTICGDSSGSSSLLASVPSNVRLTGYVPRDRLAQLYREASVYAQLSAVESFGCALAEAMLSGCTPVVSERGALPEVVGSVGERVPYGDADAAVAAVERALNKDQGDAARQHIQSRFPLETRESRLVAEVTELLEEP